MLILEAFVFLTGIVLVLITLYSAIETFVLPRAADNSLTHLVFATVRRLFDLRLRSAHTYAQRDRIMAFFAPIALLALLPFWLTLVLTGYAGMYWVLGDITWFEAFRVSGSSLLTLGFAQETGFSASMLEFSEATIGLILVALLIAYLPTIYSAFSRRETPVTLLEVRAGNPPSAVEMLQRFYRIHGLHRLKEQWQIWEQWFADVEESHTSLPVLVFFRSPRADRSWINAAGTILDAASLTLSSLNITYEAEAALCIRAGYLALWRIADFFNISYHTDPHHPQVPISISEAEFNLALDELAGSGVPLKQDREQAWQDFAGWRVNYDRVLMELADLTMAPNSRWTGDRSSNPELPPIFRKLGSIPNY
jgi:hypothetical protein